MDTFSKRGTVRKLCSAISGLMGRWVDSRHGMVTEQPSPSQEAADSLTPGADNFKTFVHDDTFQVAIISNTEHFYFQHNDIVVPHCNGGQG